MAADVHAETVGERVQPSRVLGGDDVGVLQQGDQTRRGVAVVADRRGGQHHGAPGNGNRTRRGAFRRPGVANVGRGIVSTGYGSRMVHDCGRVVGTVGGHRICQVLHVFHTIQYPATGRCAVPRSLLDVS